MNVFVKICGLANAGDARAVAELHPDAMGFVFWKGSPRCVAPRDVAAWTAGVPAGILKVGVFVDASEDDIRSTVETAGLDVVQIHDFRLRRGYGGQVQALEKAGRDFPRIGKTRGESSSARGGSAFGGKVWKVVHLTGNEAEALRGGDVDAYLLDSYSAESPGGTGRVVDWVRAREFVQKSPKPVILAGGLTPENVEKALETVGPWGVDVSSGVEARPGVKDLERVKDFIDRCRAR